MSETPRKYLDRLEDTYDEFEKLMTYVKAKEGYMPAPDAVIPLRIVKAYQALSDKTRRRIENVSTTGS